MITFLAAVTKLLLPQLLGQRICLPYRSMSITRNYCVKRWEIDGRGNFNGEGDAVSCLMRDLSLFPT